MNHYHVAVRYKDGAFGSWEIRLNSWRKLKEPFADLDNNPFGQANMLITMPTIGEVEDGLVQFRLDDVSAIEFFCVETNPLEDPAHYDDPLN